MQADDDDGCARSSTWERRCKTDAEGKLRCETIQRAWRHCPNRAPEELTLERSQSQGCEHEPMPDIFVFDHMLRQMRQLESMFGLGLFAPRIHEESPWSRRDANPSRRPAAAPQPAVRVDEV
mmetsp:Transcript_25815/g.65633  ORF Transcript_25815/g.65633 Transcript_25815/m.65633 type:complete len:122 (+) Transcript_25815:26-391(+)